MIIDDLEDDQNLQELVLSIFHATTHTFEGTPAVKIIENHLGNAFIKTAGVQQQMPIPPQLFQQLMKVQGPKRTLPPGQSPAVLESP